MAGVTNMGWDPYERYPKTKNMGLMESGVEGGKERRWEFGWVAD